MVELTSAKRILARSNSAMAARLGAPDRVVERGGQGH